MSARAADTVTMKPPTGIGRRGRQFALALLLGSLGGLALPAPAAAQALTEAQLRARFVLNFVRFTEWPDTAFAETGAPVRLCVLGSGDPVEAALASLHDATAGGRHISVRGGVTSEQAGDCHLLYVPDAELRRLVGARDAIGRHAVLIVGESEAVLDRGGMIAMRSADRHLSFVVKVSTARQNAINFSPQMLNAAAEVLP